MRPTGGRPPPCPDHGERPGRVTRLRTQPRQSSLLVGLRSPLPGLVVLRERRHGAGGMEGLEKSRDEQRAKGQGRAGARCIKEVRGQDQKGDRVFGPHRARATALLLMRKPRSELPQLSGSAVQGTTGWMSSPGVTYSDILARVHHCGLPSGHRAGVSPAVHTLPLLPWVGIGVGTGPAWGLCVTRASCLPLRKRPIENRWEKVSEREAKSDILTQRS